MNEIKLSEEQLTQLWELSQEMKIVGLPTNGDYEDIRSNVYCRCLTEANQSFLLKAGEDFTNAAKRVLRSALADELKRLSSNQAVFENGMIPFSALDKENEEGETVAFEPADPKSVERGAYPSHDADWQGALVAVYDEVQVKVRNLPHDLRTFSRGLMRGVTAMRLAARLGVSRANLYIMRNKLKVVFASTWAKLLRLRG